MITSSTGKRVFTLELVRGSKPTDLCRMVLDSAFEGSEPDQAAGEFSDGFHRHVRVLPIQEAAAVINADIAAGRGARPLTTYVEEVR
jgi:hypothetical protein